MLRWKWGNSARKRSRKRNRMRSVADEWMLFLFEAGAASIGWFSPLIFNRFFTSLRLFRMTSWWGMNGAAAPHCPCGAAALLFFSGPVILSGAKNLFEGWGVVLWMLRSCEVKNLFENKGTARWFFFQRIVNDLLATAHKQILHFAALVQNDKLMGINGAAAPHCPIGAAALQFFKWPCPSERSEESVWVMRSRFVNAAFSHSEESVCTHRCSNVNVLFLWRIFISNTFRAASPVEFRLSLSRYFGRLRCAKPAFMFAPLEVN